MTRCPELDRLATHVGDFAHMVTKLEDHHPNEWISSVEADTLLAPAAFARHLHRDFDAVAAGLTLPYSSRAVKGTINRIKILKRQMFSRAKFDLLRKQVLLTT